MSHFPQVRDPAGRPELEALYREITASGFGGAQPPNWFTALSERPDILAATWAFCRGILVGGQVPHTVKQMIVVLVSAHNGCHYCRVTHQRALRAQQVPADVIDSLTTDVNLAKVPPQQRALLAFALKTARAPQTVTDRDFEELREYGLTDGELIEVVMTAALTNFINIWSDAGGIEVDGSQA